MSCEISTSSQSIRNSKLSLDIGCQVGRGPVEQAAWHSCGGIPATPSVQEHPKPALKVNTEEAGMLQGIRPSLLLGRALPSWQTWEALILQ